MKKIIAIAAAMLLTLTAFAQKDGQKIYNKYSDAKGVSAVYMSPSMFRQRALLVHIGISMLD